MKKYVITALYPYGYERFALIREMEHGVELNVHFLEYDEYLENGEESAKRKNGDILEGNISIELVTFSKRTDKQLGFCQEIQESSHVEAIVEVVQIINEHSVYAVSSVSDDNILVEFESAIDYQAGDRVHIIGSLEMREILDLPEKVTDNGNIVEFPGQDGRK